MGRQGILGGSGEILQRAQAPPRRLGVHEMAGIEHRQACLRIRPVHQRRAVLAILRQRGRQQLARAEVDLLGPRPAHVFDGVVVRVDQWRPCGVFLRRQRCHEQRVRQRIDQLHRGRRCHQFPPQVGIGKAEVDQHDGHEVARRVDAQEAR